MEAAEPAMRSLWQEQPATAARPIPSHYRMTVKRATGQVVVSRLPMCQRLSSQADHRKVGQQLHANPFAA